MFKINLFRKPSPTPSSSAVVKQKAKRSPHYPFTEDGIRKRAQQVYEKRVEQGLEGTSEGDWKQAIRELKWERSPLGKFGRWTGVGQKNGWDLLTSVSLPIVLFAGGSLFTYWNNQQQQRIAVENRQQDLQIADDRHKQDLQIADDRTQQEILNKYLDQMADSLKGAGLIHR